MSKVVFLDTGVLGYVTHPRAREDARACATWLLGLLRQGVRICVPEVCDYELRREYLRRNSQNALRRLDQLNSTVSYVPIDTNAMRSAAQLWATARSQGQLTADAKELDVDVILVAQAQRETGSADELIIATTNVGHLSMFVAADTWRNIAA